MGLARKQGLHQHKFYVYYEENKVWARMDQLERVMVKEFALDGDHGKDADGKPITASQAAHDYVQAVVNPDKHHHSRYGVLGFLHAEFQGKISANCEKVVTAAYAAAGIKTAA